MKCEICGTEFKKIDSNLVCKMGHTIQNVVEVYDDETEFFRGRCRKIRKKRIKIIIPKNPLHFMIQKLLLIRYLYIDAKKHFGFSSDIIFKLFTCCFNLFEIDNEKMIQGTFTISSLDFQILIYISKRVEMEKANKIYLLSTFKKDLAKFNMIKKIKSIRDAYKLTDINVGFELKKVTNRILNRRFHRAVDYDLFLHRKLIKSNNETGVFLKNLENSKMAIRQEFRKDLDFLKKYFEAVCKVLEVEVTEELIFFFKKYVYSYNPNKWFIPEFDFSFLIAAYYSSKNQFKNSKLENKISGFLEFLEMPLEAMMRRFIFAIDNRSTYDSYLSSILKDNRDRFKCILMAKNTIDQFKKENL